MKGTELIRNIKLQELINDDDANESIIKLMKILLFEDYNRYRPWKHSDGYYNIEYTGKDLKNLTFKYDSFDETLYINFYSDDYKKLSWDYGIGEETACMILKMYFENKYDCVVKKASTDYDSFKSGELYCLNRVEEDSEYDINTKDPEDDTEFANNSI